MLLSIFAAGCGDASTRIKEREAMLASPSPTPGERAIAGSFTISGKDQGGLNEYTGSLTVLPKGDAYEFRWATTKGTRVGTGIQIGNSTAVSFAPTAGGKGCGVVLYRVDTVNGTLDGRSAAWGGETYTSEKATRTEGTGFPGKYQVTGKGIDGKDRSATLTITKDGAGYDFAWIGSEGAGSTPRLVGFGIWKGSYAAVSFGGPQCGFALYDIQSNGDLEGDWGGQKDVTFGKETARRQ
jgi:hypothetical protein